MDTSPEQSRRYSDEEMHRLFKRAAELHQAESADGAGFTLLELEDVAREAGISVGSLRRAAGELDRAVLRSRAAAIAGGPLCVRLEHTLPLEATPAALEAVVPLLQSASDARGQASLAKRTLAWRADSMQAAMELDILVSVRDGETRILIEERYGRMAATVFGSGVGGIGSGVGFGVGVGVGVAIGSPLMAIGFPIAFLGASYVGSRALFRAIVQRRTATLEKLLDTLCEELRTTTEEDASSTAVSDLTRESHAYSPS